LILYGEFGIYDGSGYVRDYDLKTLDADSFRASFIQLIQSGWFDKSTRAFIITFCLYEANSDKWISTMIMFELSVSGIVNPTLSQYLVFEPNLFLGHENIQAADVIRLIVSLYMLYMYVSAALERVDENRNWEYMWSFQGFCDLAIVAFTAAGFGISY
jgi:hypothetical protein